MSEFAESALETSGRFDLGPYFDAYWQRRDRHPFLIRLGGDLAGLALVRATIPGTFSMAEFFVVRGCRNSGVGAVAASKLFDQFRGRWQVAELDGNLPAQRFWRRVISKYTNGEFSEVMSDARPRGPMQVFDNSLVG